MATKSKQSKKPAALPPGLKPSKLPVNSAVRKMIAQDRAVASGGRNVVRRATALAPDRLN